MIITYPQDAMEAYTDSVLANTDAIDRPDVIAVVASPLAYRASC